MGDGTSAGSALLPTVNLVVTIALTVVAGMTKLQADRAEARLQGVKELLERQELLLKEAQEKRVERESVQRVQLEVTMRRAAPGDVARTRELAVAVSTADGAASKDLQLVVA